MKESSRTRARAWPYPRHRDFRAILEAAASTWFREHRYPVHSRYHYILADPSHWPQNIILPEVVDYIKNEQAHRKTKGEGFSLHKDLHNGLSSQAMLFNLIGPLITRNDLDILREPFSPLDIIWPEGANAHLEYVNRGIFNEDIGQPTSIDLIIKDRLNRPCIFVESKLVEQEFGGCSIFKAGDCDGRNPTYDFSLCYLHYVGRRYWSLLKRYGFLSGPVEQNTTCILATYYQFFREVILALAFQSSFVLLSDERSSVFSCDGPSGRRGLMPFLLSMVPPSLQNRIVSVSIQDVLAAIKTSGRHEWVTEFERKYGFVS